ncbi:hypothetical protein [Actinomadura fibrosa]|uniref:Immunity protein Imm1 n=1 Tax=Actinomadura fibrosa TaxID=111802 RepID=A0ABW2XF82_9ACTN|nr:hypothetical protein [Actinomadura fibrosa]
MWTLHNGNVVVHDPSDAEIVSVMEQAISRGQGELWVEHADGPVLGIVLGDSGRAMVLRLAESGDAGWHAVDPAASSEQVGYYLLANGQLDEYADRDTVETREVMPILAHFLATTGCWPGVQWHDDGAA